MIAAQMLLFVWLMPFIALTSYINAAAVPSGNNKKEIKEPTRRVCGELGACELVDISSRYTILDLFLIDVEYVLKAGALYSISCQVYGGEIDALHITYGNGERHTEREAPYWVGGDTEGIPRAVNYLATPGEKSFTVRGVLDDVDCFLLSQKLLAKAPKSDEL